LKLLPAQFFLLYEQDFPTEIAGKPLFLLLELKNPAQIAGKIELEVISSHFGRNVFSVMYFQKTSDHKSRIEIFSHLPFFHSIHRLT
jgi:hypothetical protein